MKKNQALLKDEKNNEKQNVEDVLHKQQYSLLVQN